MRLEIDVFGEKLVSRKLLFRAERLEDASPFFEGVATFLTRVEKAQFDTEGAYASGGWDELAESTIRQKARKGQSDRILVAEGLLERSLTVPGHHAQKREVSDTQLVFGSRVPYLKYHQSPAPRRHLPRRKAIELTEMDKKHIERALSLWVTRGKVVV